MTTLNLIKYQDAQKHYTNILKEVEEDRKKVSTAYQNYLIANPHKERKRLLEQQKKNAIAVILYLASIDIEQFTEQHLARFKKTLNRD